MLRDAKRLIVLAGLAVLPLVGCGADPVTYVHGFFDAEPTDDGRLFRWMGPEGVAHFKNAQRDMILTIECGIPIDDLPAPPTIRIELNGKTLDSFTTADESVVRRLQVPVALQGNGAESELKIVTSQTFVPRDRHPASQDARQLGLVIRELSWTPQ